VYNEEGCSSGDEVEDATVPDVRSDVNRAQDDAGRKTTTKTARSTAGYASGNHAPIISPRIRRRGEFE